jgi:hypothetical protein
MFYRVLRHDKHGQYSKAGSAATTVPVEIPRLETMLSPDAHEFIRLPPVGQRR